MTKVEFENLKQGDRVFDLRWNSVGVVLGWCKNRPAVEVRFGGEFGLKKVIDKNNRGTVDVMPKKKEA